jgi:Spy/CpxP family protein refolding chaperone
MKMKLKSVLAGVLTLGQASAIAALTATAITLTPVAAKAQSVNPITEIFPVLTGVDLTTAQKIQLADLGSSIQTEIGKIVSPEQRKQFQTSLGEGKGFAEALATMNITPDQQKQMQAMFVSVRTQVVSTFTPVQRQKILENMKSLLQL